MPRPSPAVSASPSTSYTLDPAVPSVQDKPKHKCAHGHHSKSLSWTAAKHSVSSPSCAKRKKGMSVPPPDTPVIRWDCSQGHALPVQPASPHSALHGGPRDIPSTPGCVESLLPLAHLDLSYPPSPLLTVPEPLTLADTSLLLVQGPYPTFTHGPPMLTAPPSLDASSHSDAFSEVDALLMKAH